jgi:hypothetical protein
VCAALVEDDPTVAPDSPESRIARSEERIESNRRQIEMLGPLPLQVGLVQRGQEELRDDLAQMRADMDRRFEKEAASRQEWQERFERSMGNRFATCSNEIAQVAERFDRFVTAEEARREREKTIVAQSSTERLVARYGRQATLGAAVIAAVAAILNNFLG